LITGAAASTQFKAIYSILLFGGFFIAIFRFKQQKQDLENKNTYLVTLNKERENELIDILRYREEVLKGLNADEKEVLDQTAAAYLQQVLYRMADYMKLNVTKIDLEQLLTDVKTLVKLTDFETVTPQIITEIKTQQQYINGDLTKIKQLLINGIVYIHKLNLTQQPITIAVEDALLGHKVDYINDYIRELKAIKFTITTNELLTNKNIYMLDEVPFMEQHKKIDRLVESMRIIHAHYGYSALLHEHTQIYVLPINLREIRGKVMEILREPNLENPAEISHPLAIKVEKELFSKVIEQNMNITLVTKALNIIKKYHAGVKRKSGEPFFTHPIQVAIILLEYCKDQDALLSALLHDTVEDTGLSLIQIKAIFGEQVAFIVGKVTNLEDNLRRISSTDYESICRLIDYEDERAVFVKLADRMHNMRTINGHPSLDKRKYIASETLSFFVPLAQHFNLTTIANELKKLSIEVLTKQ